MKEIRVAPRLEKVDLELKEIARYTATRGGITIKNARSILRSIENIIESCEAIFQDASGTSSETYDEGFFRGR